MDVERNRKAYKRLNAIGVHSYVVMTPEAGKAGLTTNFPLGFIVSLRAPFTVNVRKLGQRKVGSYAAAFWQPMPNRLINYLR